MSDNKKVVYINKMFVLIIWIYEIFKLDNRTPSCI